MSNGMEIQLSDVRRHEAVLAKQQEQLDKWCTTGDIRAEALIRYALAEMSTNDDLRQCTPTSIYLALLACGVTGLVPGKLRGFAFLVPFGNTKRDGDNEYKVQEATFMVGWRGVRYQGYRAGLDMVSAVIRDQDDFEFDLGSNSYVRYKPALKAPGVAIGAAAWAKLPRGGLQVEYLNRETLSKIKAAATRIRKSPAWDGPFADQMERKSALRRLGKQTEMGEDFFKAQAIEQAQDDHGYPTQALDQLTDGSASRFLGRQSAEAAAFEGLPRQAQAQVPAAATGIPPASNRNRTAATTGSDKPSAPMRTQGSASETSNGSPTPSAASPPPTAAKLDAAKAKVEAKANPAGGAGSTPQTTSATPAANSQPAASTTDSSTGSVSTPPALSSVPDAPPPIDSQEFGDVATEPRPDEDFDTSFGDEDPVDRDSAQPMTRHEWVAAFQAWAAAHPSRESVLADASWQSTFRSWCTACATKAEMDEHKPVFISWAKGVFSVGRREDRVKGIAAVAGDSGSSDMQKMFADRYKAVP